MIIDRACRTGVLFYLKPPVMSRSPEKWKCHDGQSRLVYRKIYSRWVRALDKKKMWFFWLSEIARWLGSATRRQPMIERLGHLFACTAEWPWAVAWYTRIQNRSRVCCYGRARVSQPNASGVRLVRRIFCRWLSRYRPLADVAKFKYLGSMYVANGQGIRKIRGRVNGARSAFSRLQTCLLSWREISLRSKGRVYFTIVRSILHCCETWPEGVADERMWEVFDNESIRYILRLRRRDNVPTVELRHRLCPISTPALPVQRRLHWFDHATLSAEIAASVSQIYRSQGRLWRPKPKWLLGWTRFYRPNS